MYRMSYGVLGLSLFLCLGCGGGGASGPPQETPSEQTAVPVDQLKQTLEQIAQTGEAGSALMNVRPSVEALNQSDPAKGGPLMQDLAKLEGATNPEEIKSIAKKMASQL